MGAKHGDFDLTSAYRLAMELGPPQPFHGSWVWSIKTLPRIQTFLWKCCHNNIGVKECLVARGMELETCCPLCHGDIESIEHALRSYPIIATVWNALGIINNNGAFFVQNFHT